MARLRISILIASIIASTLVADDLRTAERLAWDKRFAESEARPSS